MAEPGWTSAFETVLREHLPLLQGDPLLPDTPLADAGLDSLGTVALLIALEDELDVMIPDEQVDVDTFATAGSLWGVVAATSGQA